MTVRRSLAALVTVVALTLAGLGSGVRPASAQDSGSSGNDNTAIAINTKDGSSLFKFAFSIARTTGETVDAGNAAVAYASCTDCQTVAVAVQFVIVEGSPDIFTPTNLAIAENVSCSLCTTMADAYQFVIQTSGPVHLTADGERRLRDLIDQLRKLGTSDLPLDALQAKIDDLVHQMAEVMATELVPAGPPPDTTSAAATPSSTTSTTVAHDTATTTSTTEVVRSTTTTAAPSTTASTSSTTTSTTAPTTTTTTAP